MTENVWKTLECGESGVVVASDVFELGCILSTVLRIVSPSCISLNVCTFEPEISQKDTTAHQPCLRTKSTYMV